MMKFFRILSCLTLFIPTVVFGQSVGQLQPGQVLGNTGASQAPPSGVSMTAIIDKGFCTTQNALLVRGASNWGCLTSSNNSVLVTNGSGVPGWATTLPSGLAATNMNLTTPTLGVAAGTSLALNGATIGTNALAVSGTTTLTSNSAQALAVGANGATNPAFTVNASAGTSATGLRVSSNSAGGGTAVDVTSSGTNEALTLNAKGSGTVSIGNTSTGTVNIGGGGGGLTVTNSFTATGLVTFADMATAAVATSSQYLSGASNVLVPASVIYSSETTTTFGATTTFDFSTFINTAVTLTANITTMTLSNVKAGQSGQIRFIQDGTGSRTTVWNSIFKFAGGVTPTLSTAANSVDALEYSCISTSYCVASLIQNVK